MVHVSDTQSKKSAPTLLTLYFLVALQSDGSRVLEHETVPQLEIQLYQLGVIPILAIDLDTRVWQIRYLVGGCM